MSVVKEMNIVHFEGRVAWLRRKPRALALQVKGSDNYVRSIGAGNNGN